MTTETLPEVRPAPAEPTTPIKPSEAIRLGCLIAPVQLFDSGYINNGSACVFGAMALGYGGDRSMAGQLHWDIYERQQDADRIIPRCPIVGCSEGAFLVHLNDDHRWSREHIADWLAEQGL